MLDKGSLVPLYIQFKDYLLAQIKKGELRPGQQLPPTSELCKQFGVSRITIRKALEELMLDGVIKTVKGKGTYVAQQVEQDFHPLVSFSQQMQNLDRTPTNHVLNQKITYATAGLANELTISVGSPIIFIERLRFANNEPWAWQTAYLPQMLCPDLLDHDLQTRSLYQILREKYNLIPFDSENRYDTRLASAEEREILALPEPSAVLVMRQTSFLENGRPFEYTRTIYRPNIRFRSRYSHITLDTEVTEKST